MVRDIPFRRASDVKGDFTPPLSAIQKPSSPMSVECMGYVAAPSWQHAAFAIFTSLLKGGVFGIKVFLKGIHPY